MKGKNRVHKGIGFSDHLPIFAIFSTSNYSQDFKTKIISKDSIPISALYEIDNLEKVALIKNVVVIYKNNNNAIIKQIDNRAVYIYNQASNLTLGKVYDLRIKKIKIYHGLKEITKIDSTKFKHNFTDYKILYADANSIDILDFNSQNEIVTNLRGTYKKGYIHYIYKNLKQKIKLYSKNQALLPKNGQKINIISGHLSFYKSNAQIIIYKESDFSVN